MYNYFYTTTVLSVLPVCTNTKRFVSTRKFISIQEMDVLFTLLLISKLSLKIKKKKAFVISGLGYQVMR